VAIPVMTIVAVAIVAVAAVTIPLMVVVAAAAVAVPVTVKVAVAIMMRRNPARAAVNWSRPIPVVPPVAAVYHIPVAVDPDISASWTPRHHPNHPGRWWRAYSNSNGNLGGQASANK
jgi:hypothetical protein